MSSQKSSLLSRLRSTRGYSMIETAVVLVALLPVMVGTFDVAKGLRAYTALREGVEVTMKCLYPTDAACTRASAANYSEQSRLYNWYLENRVQTDFVRMFDYSATASWMQHPVYTYDSYRGRVLDQVSYDLPSQPYVANVTTYTATQRLAVIRQTNYLPRISGSNPRFPNFGYDGVTLALPKGSLLVDSRNSSLEVNVKIPQPASLTAQQNALGSSVKCFPVDSDKGINFQGNCAAGSKLNTHTPVVLWIKARAIEGKAGDTSKINLSAEFDGKTVPLGGQVFRNPGKGKSELIPFYPRGYGGKEGNLLVDENLRYADSTKKEVLGEWTYKLELPYKTASNNPVVTIHFDKVRGGDLSWDSSLSFSIEEIHAFFPRYDQFTFESDPSPSFSSCAQNTFVPTVGTTTFGATDAARIGAPKYTSGALSKTPMALGAFQSVEEATAYAQSLSTSGTNGAPTCTYANVQAIGVPTTETKSDACPAANKGGKTEAEKMAACPPSNSSGKTVTNIRWSTRQVSLPQYGIDAAGSNWETIFEKSSCESQFSFSPPPALAEYKDWDMPAAADFNSSKTRWVANDIGGQNPAIVRAQDKKYQCAELQIATKKFEGEEVRKDPVDSDSTYWVPTNSILSGARPELLAGVASCLNDQVANDVKQFLSAAQVPSSAWIEPTATFVKEIEVSKEHATALQSTGCTPIRISSALKDRTLLSSNASSAPAQCKAAGATCSSELVGFVGQTNPGVTYDKGIAKSLGLNEMAATYPSAVTSGCRAGEDFDCPSLEISDPINDRVRVTSKLLVPLTLIPGQKISLGYSAERNLERKHAW